VDRPRRQIAAVPVPADLLCEQTADAQRLRVDATRAVVAVLVCDALKPLDAAAPHTCERQPEAEPLVVLVVVLTIWYHFRCGGDDRVPQVPAVRALTRSVPVPQQTRWPVVGHADRDAVVEQQPMAAHLARGDLGRWKDHPIGNLGG